VSQGCGLPLQAPAACTRRRRRRALRRLALEAWGCAPAPARQCLPPHHWAGTATHALHSPEGTAAAQAQVQRCSRNPSHPHPHHTHAPIWTLTRRPPTPTPRRVPDLNLGRLAMGMGLLRLPRLPDVKKSRGTELFVASPLDPELVRYKDRAREKQRQQVCVFVCVLVGRGRGGHCIGAVAGGGTAEGRSQASGWRMGAAKAAPVGRQGGGWRCRPLELGGMGQPATGRPRLTLQAAAAPADPEAAAGEAAAGAAGGRCRGQEQAAAGGGRSRQAADRQQAALDPGGPAAAAAVRLGLRQPGHRPCCCQCEQTSQIEAQANRGRPCCRRPRRSTRTCSRSTRC
jgi:hypothetical protein